MPRPDQTPAVRLKHSTGTEETAGTAEGIPVTGAATTIITIPIITEAKEATIDTITEAREEATKVEVTATGTVGKTETAGGTKTEGAGEAGAGAAAVTTGTRGGQEVEEATEMAEMNSGGTGAAITTEGVAETPGTGTEITGRRVTVTERSHGPATTCRTTPGPAIRRTKTPGRLRAARVRTSPERRERLGQTRWMQVI